MTTANTPFYVTRGATRHFPDNFAFGAAAAAYQIEGAAFEDGRQASIWDTFARVPGAVLNGDNGDVACDHYHRYRDDAKLMAELGLDIYRFSISWARVMPDGKTLNPQGLDFYSRLVDELLANGIDPWVTLYHWDLPQALENLDGWVNRDTSYRFRDYSMAVYNALQDRVPTWTTLNEPWCSSFLSYTAGVHAPGRQSIHDGLLASHHLLLGHGLTLEAMRTEGHDRDLGITLNLTVADPVNESSPADREAARKIDGQFNRWFLDPIFRGSYPDDAVADIRTVDPVATEQFEAAILPGDMELISGKIDALGINYYQGDVVAGSPVPPPPDGSAPTSRPGKSPYPNTEGVYFGDRGLPKSAMNWDVDSVNLTRILTRVHEEYSAEAGTALFVTENGTAYIDEVTPGEVPAVNDQERSDYLELHLGAVLDAIDSGADVRGYFYWSVMDNYEWAWGYSQRFGIIHVDYATQDRIIKQSGRTYQDIISRRTIDVVPDAGKMLELPL